MRQTLRSVQNYFVAFHPKIWLPGLIVLLASAAGFAQVSDIIANTTFTYPTNIAYSTLNESADITNSGTSLVVAKFDIRDGGAAGTDAGPDPTTLTDLTLNLTNSSFIKRIALYDAAGTAEIASTEQTVSGASVSWTGLSIAAPDNGTISFTVRVSFNSTVTDNQAISFSITSATATGSGFAAGNAGGAVSSTSSDNNKIEVTATKLKWVQNASNVAAGANMSPSPSIEATDVNDNRDLDFTGNVTITSTGTEGGTLVVAAASGLATFGNITHSAVGTGFTMTGTSAGLTDTPASSTFNVTPSNVSDVIVNAGFAYPTNIAYATFNENTDITNSGTSIVVAKFDIRDGGGSSDSDGLPTVVTDLSLDLGTNFGMINRIALYQSDETTEIATTEQAVGTQTVNFTGLSLSAADNGSATFSVRISFKSTVTDNAQISVKINSVTEDAANSGIPEADGDGGGTGAISSTAGDNNRIEVAATKLRWVQNASNVFVGVAMTPSPTVEATDANNNRDLDYVTNVAVSSTGTEGGTLSVAPVSGLATFSNITHSAVGTGLTMTATSGGLTDTGVSATFNVSLSNASDIIANAAFTYPTNIAYATFNEAANITNSGTSLVVAKFDIRDGGGAADADLVPTVVTDLSLDLGSNFAFINRIALYQSDGTTEIGSTEQAVSSQTVNFTGLSLSAADGGSFTFSVRVSFKSTVTDNQQITVKINSVTEDAANSGIPEADGDGGGSGAISSTTGDNNRIEVTATKLRWVQNPSNTFVGAVMSPSPTVEATDANNNRDLDNTATITVTSTGTEGGTLAVAAVSGLATFSDITHSATGTGLTMSATGGGLTASGASTTFDVSLSNTSDIVINPSFTHPTNIAYSTYNETTDLTTSNSLVVAQFTIRDGGASADGDAVATTLTGITLDFGSNFAFINQAAIYASDGTTELSEKDVNAQTEAFTLSANMVAPDNGTYTFSVRVSFRSTVTDNQQFSILINAAPESASGSQFAAANGGGAVTSTSGDDNRIEVTATKLRWVQDPSNVDINDVMSPSPTVEATDANNVRDLDFVGNVAVTSTGTESGTLSVAAVSGLATFSNIIHTVAETGRTMSATSTGLTGSGASATFDVIAVSVVSDIIANASFTYPTNINYAANQSANLTSGSLSVAEFIIRDGATSDDGDNKSTTLNTLTISVSNSSILRRIALYDGTTELNEQPAGSSVTFSGFTVSAPDGTGGAAGLKTIIIRASFQSAVTDNTQFSFTITAAGTSTGSQFALANAGGASTSTIGDNNRIEVTASKLRFVQQPSNAYISVAMTPAPTVEAADANNNRDLDYVTNVTMATSGTMDGTSTTVVAPVSGLATFSNIKHSASGTGLLLTATSGGLTNAVSNTFDITGSATSDIIANAGFVYPTNIAYVSIQEAADVQNDANSINVARFDVRDGGTASPDADAFGTTLTDLTLDLGSNYTYIRRIALYDATGTTEIAGTDQAVTTQTVNFTGLTINAADGGSTSFTVRVSFTTAIVDNQQISFTVTAATAQAGGSIFAAVNAGGAASSTAGDNNRIEVVATQLRFVQEPTTTVVNIAMSPSPSVEAVDANNIRDLDNAAPVSATSDGILSTSPSTVLSAGLGTFSTVTHSAAGTALSLFTSNVSGLTNATSAQFNIVSASSDIIANAVFTYPSNVTYVNFQENADIQNSGTSLAVAQFDIRDGGGAIDGDPYGTTLTDLSLDLGSNFTYIRRIALYDALGFEIAGTDQAVSTQTVNFAGLSITAPDNGTASFIVRVSFTTAVTDNQQYRFMVSSATAQTGNNSRFASANAGGALTPIAGDINRIEVIATKLLFVQQPSNTLVSVAMSPSASVEATDANNIRDLDNASSIGLFSSGSLTPGATATLASGIGTYSNIVHTAAGTALTLTTTNSSGLANAVSSSFTIIAASSDIIANVLFTYPTNITYENFQENANIQNTGTSLNVARFDIRDGGGAVDGDNFPTTLTDLTLDLGANYTFIRRIALYDAAGTNEIASTEQAVSTQLVGFSGLSLTAADNGTLSFTVRVSFTTAVVDNSQISFTVFSATSTTGDNSRFALANASGAVSSTTANNNRIEVTATKLLFVQQPTTTSNGATMTPSPTVEAVDANNRRDLDISSTIGVTSTGTMTGSPQNAVFSSGLGTYSSIVHTVNGTSLTLSTNSGGLTNATSSTFDITSSSNSDIIANTLFAYPTNIAYDTKQENTNIVNTATSLVVAKFDVRDGGGANDIDLAPTVLTNVTLDLGANYTYIRRIALYDALGTTEIAEQAVSAQTVSFAGLSLTAPDNGSVSFTVRVSFTTAVVDNQQISFMISSATGLGGVSGFAAANGGGAISSTTGDNNRIEVTATKVLFVQQPTDVLTGVVMSPAVTIRTTDDLNNLDLDYSGTASILSNGLPSAAGTAAVAGGLGTVSNIVHSHRASARTLTAQLGTLIDGTSVTFNVTSSNASDIILDPLFVEPSNILYSNFQATDINPADLSTSIEVARFIMRDGGATLTDADLVGTLLKDIEFTVLNVSALRRVALYDNLGNELAELGATTPLSFTNLNLGNGYATADNASRTFSIRVSFNNTSANVTDNTRIQFTISNATTTLNSSEFVNSTAGAIAATTSTTLDENRIEVVASKFVFTTAPTATIYANVPFSPGPLTLEARDGNDVKDLDYNTTVDVSNAGGVPMTDGAGHTSVTSFSATFASGELILNNQLRYDIRGDGDGTLKIQDLSPGIALSSDPIAILVSATSDIVEASFAYPDNILYKDYQATNIDLTSGGDEIEVAQFTLRDGGASSPDLDQTPTQLSSITFALTNSPFIRQLALYDGATELGEVTVAGSLVTFNGLNIAAADNGTLTLSLYATFNTTVTDNQKITFTVNSATVNPDKSTFSTGSTGNAGSATTQVPAADDNKIEVVATQIDFTTIPTTASINVPFTMIAEGRDLHQNRDLDYNGTPTSEITAFANTSSYLVTNGPALNTDFFTSGVFNFNANFQFTSGTSTTQFTITAGGISGTSPIINVVSSFDSRIQDANTYPVGDPYYFAYGLNVPYDQHQATDITAGPTSFELARFVLHDGDPAAPYPAGKKDVDGAPTVLQDLDVEIATTLAKLPIRKIAVYANGVEIQELTPAALSAGKSVTSFNSVNISTIGGPTNNGDEGDVVISIRVSFLNNSADVIDNDQLTVRISSATAGTGSKFLANPGYIAGVNGGLQTPTINGENKIEVTATKLDFIQSPPAFAGINEPVPLTGTPVIKVQARDQYNLIDLDFDNANGASPIISAPAGINSSTGTFTLGEMLLPALQYTGVGDGKLTVTTAAFGSIAALSSNTATFAGVNPVVPCTAVNVINTYTTLATTGVLTSVSLAGGSVNKVVFGFTVNVPYSVPGQPKLNKFTISFSNPLTQNGVDIFTNPRVYRSNTPAYTGSAVDVTSGPGGSAVVTQNLQSIDVDFTLGTPIDMSAATLSGSVRQVSFFLMVDVDKAANSGTLALQPSVTDLGYSDPSTDGNIVVTQGSSYSNDGGGAVGPTAGNAYTFAAIFPPTLVSSNPAVGQLNVDPATIFSLTFDVPVYSYDQKIYLYEKAPDGNDVLFAELTALNGSYYDGSGTPDAGTPLYTLQFQLPQTPAPVTMQPDKLYYVLIDPGVVPSDIDRTTGKGIADKAKNLFPGISSSSTLYFKTAKPVAPKLLEATIENVTLSGFTLKSSFDQQGTAYYLVLPNNSTGITVADIRNPSYPGKIVQGSFTINNATKTGFTPVYQYATIGAALADGVDYDVWITAENDAEPAPFAAANPYNGGTFEETATGSPTVEFTGAAPAGPGIMVNSANTSICPDSYQFLFAPIFIAEFNDNDFDDGQGSPINQTFNILLPPGYTFDVTLQSGQPKYGKLDLVGSDFVPGSGSMTFLSSSVLQVKFQNSSNGSFDIISISGLKVFANSDAASASSKVTRLGGNAMPSLPDGTELATISLYNPEPPDFTNTYTGGATNIPDNFNAGGGGTVTLIPDPIDTWLKGDFGPSTFSGQGVTGDKLYLEAVALNVTFPITMLHTDLNGCITETVVNYQVYDHTRAFAGVLPEYSTTYQYSTTPAAPTQVNIGYQSFGSAYWLEELTSDLPLSVLTLEAQGRNPDQILNTANGWRPLIQSLVKQGTGTYVPAADKTFYDYYFSLLDVNNAGGVTPNPFYAQFEKSTPTGEIYGTGGSLGFIELNGVFRSVANQVLTINIVQQIELHIPAVPIIVIPTNPSSAATPDYYCERDGNIIINGYPAAAAGSSTGVFTLATPGGTPLPGLTDNGNGTASINPVTVSNALAALNIAYSDVVITYEYQANDAPDKSTTSKTIRVVPNPVPNFRTTKLCEKEDIGFTDMSTIPVGNVAVWTWDFGDNNANPNNANTAPGSLLQNPVHYYEASGSYSVTFHIESDAGCIGRQVSNAPDLTRALDIGGIPTVAFSKRGVSTNTPFTFNPSVSVSGVYPIDQAVWDFGDTQTQTVLANPGVTTHSYTQIGPATVMLTVTTDEGCVGSHTEPIVVLDHVAPTDASPFIRDFSASGANFQVWPINSIASPNSWEYKLGGWSSTANNNSYFNNEKSALYTVSFDLTGLSRPILAFENIYKTAQNDGVSVQFSLDNKNITDPTKEWYTIGNTGSGINWYNTSGIAANPGDQPTNQFGFSQGAGPAPTFAATLQESKHSLAPNDVKPSDIPLAIWDAMVAAGKTRVVIRYALASNAGNNGGAIGGYRVDNFAIGSGNRTVLLENFTNTSSNNVKTQNDVFRAFPGLGTLGTEFTKIDYHIAITGDGANPDPFNEENPADPGARALYYNIKSVPQTRMDGGVSTVETDGDLFSEWGAAEYNRRILDLADATIDATVDVSDGSIKVSGSFTTLAALPDTTLLHIAIIEKNVTLTNNSSLSGRIGSGEDTFNYVLKKMLPSAAGTRFIDLQANVTQTFSAEWTNPTFLSPNDDVAVVIFLQKETPGSFGRRKIYQSFMIDNVTEPSTVVGVDPEKVIGLFPNPADHEFTFELATPVSERTPVRLYDQMGKVVSESYLEKGESKKTIGTSTFSAGVYLLQLDAKENVMRKKVMVVHEN